LLKRRIYAEDTREQAVGKNILTYVTGRKRGLHEENFMIFNPSNNYQDVQIKDDDICEKK